MRILVATKFWFRRGGLENVALDEVDWLEAHGHEVAHFSTAREQNQPSPWSRYFVTYYELGAGGGVGGAGKVRAAARMLYNREAARKFGALLDDFRPDIVHAHGIHRQLSPSILRVARGRGVPVVQTLHDYHPICPQDLLTRGGAAVCEPRLCRGHNYWPCVQHRCMQGSRAVSAVAATELFWRRWIMRYDSLVDRFISPSRFLGDMIGDAGYRTPVSIVPNAVAPEHLEIAEEVASGVASGAGSPAVELPEGPFFLYAGRVAHDKGADTIVDAAGRAGMSLVVAGDGPLLETLAAARPPNVVFVGRLERRQIGGLLTAAVGSVVPSQWYENASISVLEAMAAGRPVVASRIAGITEQIREGVDGFLLAPDDVDGFADAMRRLGTDPDLAARMGAAARERALDVYGPQRHGEQLVAVYERTLAEHARGAVARGRGAPA